jgi:hypothetical protein
MCFFAKLSGQKRTTSLVTGAIFFDAIRVNSKQIILYINTVNSTPTAIPPNAKQTRPRGTRLGSEPHRLRDFS